MNFILFALKPAEPENIERLFSRLSKHGVSVKYDGHAPAAWVVSYTGSVGKLTDLVWPDGIDRTEYEIPLGIIIECKKELRQSINGLAYRTWWEIINPS